MERIEMVIGTFEDAMEVHKKLFGMLREKGVVYYKDFIDMSCPDEKHLYKGYENYGWDNLNDMTIGLRFSKNWAIKMPKLIKIEKEID